MGRPASASPVQAGSPRRGRCRWSSPSARAEPAPAGGRALRDGHPAPGGQRGGQRDARPALVHHPHPGRVVVSQLDVVGLQARPFHLPRDRRSGLFQRGGLVRPNGSSAEAAVAAEEPEGITLPARRDVGFTVSGSTASPGHGADPGPGPRLPGGGAPPAPPGPARGLPDLFSDDASGYRVDVSRNGGPYRSLTRHLHHRGGAVKGDVVSVEAHDEGMVRPHHPHGSTTRRATRTSWWGGELFGIDGPRPRPGPRWWPRRRGPTVAPVDPGPAPATPSRSGTGWSRGRCPACATGALQLPGPGGRPGRQLDLAASRPRLRHPGRGLPAPRGVVPPVVIQPGQRLSP